MLSPAVSGWEVRLLSSNATNVLSCVSFFLFIQLWWLLVVADGLSSCGTRARECAGSVAATLGLGFPTACGTLLPSDQGPTCIPALQGRVLTTGPPLPVAYLLSKQSPTLHLLSSVPLSLPMPLRSSPLSLPASLLKWRNCQKQVMLLERSVAWHHLWGLSTPHPDWGLFDGWSFFLSFFNF